MFAFRFRMREREQKTFFITSRNYENQTTVREGEEEFKFAVWQLEREPEFRHHYQTALIVSMQMAACMTRVVVALHLLKRRDGQKKEQNGKRQRAGFNRV